MDFETKKTNYARLIVRYGLNIQPGQILNVSAEVCHRDLAYRVAEEAYRAGALHVTLDLAEPRLEKLRVHHLSEEQIRFVPPFLPLKYRDLVDQQGANLRIVGAENPDLMAGLDAQKINAGAVARLQAIKYFYDEGIGRSRVHWTVAAAATAGWGKKVFPEVAPEQAEALLWEELFKICRVDRPDYLEEWHEHNRRLKERAAWLNRIGLREIVVQGPGTDLRIGLSPLARFRAGSDRGPRGADFEPNLPTEECFTTPDWRTVEGVVTATRPFLINGKMVRKLKMDLSAGEIRSFSAEEGEDIFRQYIQSDAGARRLGEIALVDVTSPVYQSGLVFQEILLDENAACHIAVGSGYKFCLEGGAAMTKEQLVELGCNDSVVHTDIMISSEQTSISGRGTTGSQISVMDNGRWSTT